jgi:hypothetical protein
MFSNGYVAWLVRREYNRDRTHEAERYRLVKQACLARRRRDPFYCQALAWFGQRLVHWGLHLQERYAALADPVLLDAANQSR